MYLESHIKDLDADIRKLFQKIEALGGVIKGIDPIQRKVSRAEGGYALKNIYGFPFLSPKQVHMAMLEGG